MLGKMIKHEFRATARLYVPIFIIIIALTPTLGILFRLSRRGFENNPFSIAFGVSSVASYALVLYVAYVAAFLVIAIRFYRTTATSEAYLTFCLPVNPHQVIISKLIVGFVWQLCTAIIVVGSIYVMIIMQGVIQPGEMTKWIAENLFNMDGTDYIILIKFFVHLAGIYVVGLISSNLQYFLAITIGQLFNGHRVIASIGIYIGIYTAIQFITMTIMMPIVFFSDNIAMHYDLDQVLDAPLWIFDITTIESLVLAVVFYIFTALIMKKRLNVR